MNSVTLVGNLGDAPKTGESEKGAWARFSLATTERFKDSQGKAAERTDWHQVYCFGPLAKTLTALTKGAKVAVHGKLRRNTFERDGEQQVAVEVQAFEVEFLRRGREREQE
jgi:single-strand DNA-binding protein